jgi:tetraacyldisaccharide 4'-kinase
MLARQLPGASVLVSSNRYLAGRLAEHHLGATVHLLDDGFQHLQLDRDIDIVIVRGEDLAAGARTLPGGRLREPPDVLVAADAILAADDHAYLTGNWPAVFSIERSVGAPRTVAGEIAPCQALAFAGIAGPERFFDDLRRIGWPVAAAVPFRDHYRYTRRDLARLVSMARSAGAELLLTTEKDYVRVLPFRPFALPMAWLPLTMEPDPLPAFRAWLSAQLHAARDEVVDVATSTDRTSIRDS